MKQVFWNAYSRPYRAVSSLIPYQEMLDEVVESLEIKQNLKVLDAGCGTGNLAKKLLESKTRSLRIECFDSSKEMLCEAKKVLAGYKNIKIFTGDLDEYLNYPDETFHRITCVNVLYGLRDPQFALSELTRVLRVGGSIVLVNPHRAEKKMLYNILFSHFCKLLRKKSIGGIMLVIKQLPQFFLLLKKNLAIVKEAQNKKIWFFSPKELEILFQENGLTVKKEKLTYADSAVLICGIKSGKSTRPVNISVRVITTATDLEKFFRLRYRIYCEYLNSLDSNAYPARAEVDIFDQFSIHFGAFEEDRLVGCVRFVKDSEQGFLLDSSIDLPKTLNRSTTLEGSRLIGHRRHGIDIASLLLRFAFDYTKRAGYTHWLAMWNRNLLPKHVFRYGNHWKPLGPPIEYHNTTSVPYLLQLEGNIYKTPP